MVTLSMPPRSKQQHFPPRSAILSCLLILGVYLLWIGQSEEKHWKGTLLDFETNHNDRNHGGSSKDTSSRAETVVDKSNKRLISIHKKQPLSESSAEAPIPKRSEAKNRHDTTTTAATAKEQSNDHRPTVKPNSPYAYTFLIGGANPKDFGSYRGYIYNILVANKILRHQGSTADVVLWCQISSKSNATTLPRRHEAWLSSAGIQLRYLPQTKTESFIDIIMEKFRILSMTEYRRVLFLDSDLLPMGNLDYFFTLSDPQAPRTPEYWHDGLADTRGQPPLKLKENIILAGLNVPMCAGFFMVNPRPGDYERALELIHRKFLEGYQRDLENEDTDVLIDPVNGWGHRITRPDYWMTRKGRHFREWTWYDVEADQGFGYHWPKYEKKSVSILYFNKLEQWGADDKGKLVMEELVTRPFDRYANSLITDYHICKKYLCDHYHFDANEKPWVVGPPRDVDYANKQQRSESRLKSPLHLWFHTLFELNEELSLQADITHWEPDKMMPLKSHFKWGVKIRNKMAAIQEGIASESILYEGKFRIHR